MSTCEVSCFSGSQVERSSNVPCFCLKRIKIFSSEIFHVKSSVVRPNGGMVVLYPSRTWNLKPIFNVLLSHYQSKFNRVSILWSNRFFGVLCGPRNHSFIVIWKSYEIDVLPTFRDLRRLNQWCVDDESRAWAEESAVLQLFQCWPLILQAITKFYLSSVLLKVRGLQILEEFLRMWVSKAWPAGQVSFRWVFTCMMWQKDFSKLLSLVEVSDALSVLLAQLLVSLAVVDLDCTAANEENRWKRRIYSLPGSLVLLRKRNYQIRM